jgi:hypothetical protein
MSSEADRAEAVARFNRARLRVSLAAALLHTIDLDLVEGFYERAGSPQGIIAGTVTPDLLPTVQTWAVTLAAARELRDSIQFEPATLAQLERIIGAINPPI